MNLFFTYYFWCAYWKKLVNFSAIWDAGQGEMTSQEWQRKPNFSLHETEELIQIITEQSQLMFGVGCLKRIQPGRSKSCRVISGALALSAPRTVNYLGFRGMTLQVHLKMYICNSSTNLSQQFRENSKNSKKS